jgi:hypothetical protein
LARGNDPAEQRICDDYPEAKPNRRHLPERAPVRQRDRLVLEFFLKNWLMRVNMRRAVRRGHDVYSFVRRVGPFGRA